MGVDGVLCVEKSSMERETWTTWDYGHVRRDEGRNGNSQPREDEEGKGKWDVKTKWSNWYGRGSDKWALRSGKEGGRGRGWWCDDGMGKDGPWDGSDYGNWD